MTASMDPITLVTRASPLAVAQTKYIQHALAQTLGVAEAQMGSHLPILPLTTSGDKNLAGSLAQAGGKGLFTKEIEEALLDGRADIAVHSMKDMPALLPPGLKIGAIPKRENPADSFIAPEADHPSHLPEGAIIGTSSVRRRAQILRLRPDLTLVPLRGNVGTRLDKIKNGVVAGTFLAEAGLRRLDLRAVSRSVLSPAHWLPALTQGALCLQIRDQDERTAAVLKAISCEETSLTIAVERGFLGRLDGSCQTPMAGLAIQRGKSIVFSAELLSLDGTQFDHIEETIPIPASQALEEKMTYLAARGAEAAEKILTRLPASLKEELGLDD